MRQLLGPNLFDLTTSPGCRADARCSQSSPKTTSANTAGAWPGRPTVADNWVDGTQVDLDSECRRLTLRALGRSVLGLDLDDHSDAIAEPLRVRRSTSLIGRCSR